MSEESFQIKSRSNANAILLLLFIIAFILRFYKTDSYPYQINVDEISNIYDGYSILETGADRHGNESPILLYGFGAGDNRTAAYAWVCAASFKLFGVSITNGRLPSAFFGILSLFILFLAADKIGGRTFALLSLFAGTLLPWHILFSRMALEGSMLPPLFIILILWMWIVLKEKGFNPYYLFLVALVCGVSTNAYPSSRVSGAIAMLLIYIDLLKHKKGSFKNHLLIGAGFCLGAFPQLFIALTAQKDYLSRAHDTMIPFSFSPGYFMKVGQYLCSNLFPKYLFFDFGSPNNLTIARLLFAEALFFYPGLLFINRYASKSSFFRPWMLYILFMATILPAALTTANPHALRASGSMMFMPLFIASGMLWICNLPKNRGAKKTLLALSITAIAVNGGINLKQYVNSSELRDAGQQHILVKMAEKVNQLQSSYNRIYIDDGFNQPYIYVAWYCGIKPGLFQKMPKEVFHQSDHFDKITAMGKFYFIPDSISGQVASAIAGNTLMVMRTRPASASILDSVSLNNRSLYFYEIK
ncbi:MAG TPA: glycosyltransferase family 39 protein [Bacteroidia bacterium]|nr:glycosyltransferase family 39 protein [Bacteroidia bacterium]